MTATKILDRLEGVRPTGSGRWLAKCPAHEDRRASLSIRELDDGRLLLHDFAGCETGDVLGALGLTLSDLFPDGAKGNFAPSHSRIPASDILKAISEDVQLVGLIGAAVLEHQSINDRGWQALVAAVARIGNARDLIR